MDGVLYRVGEPHNIPPSHTGGSLLRRLGITVRSNTIQYMTCRHDKPYGTLKLGLCDKKVGCVYGRKVTFALAISMLVTSP
jgi:hypothetical protein